MDLHKNYSIRGEDQSGEHLWEARYINEKWLSTARSFLIVEHLKLSDVLEWWLNEVPITYRITSSWGSISYPSRVVPNSIASLVHSELVRIFPLGPNA